MAPPSDEPRLTRWFVYLAGSAVFVAIPYFCLRHFFDAAVGVSLGIAVPVGLLGFWILAKVLENLDTPPGFWDNTA
jgi:hypothetical protein